MATLPQNKDLKLNIHLTEEGISEIRKAVSEYDYIRFAVADLYGVARGVIVPAKKVSKYLESGLNCYSGRYTVACLTHTVDSTQKEYFCIYYFNQNMV